MSDDFDTTEWATGQPPPWLDAYGPPPIDTHVVAAPAPQAQIEPPPPPAIDQSQVTASAAAAIPDVQPQSTQQAPTAPLAVPSFVPPWLKAMEPPQGVEGQIASAADQGIEFKPSADKLADLNAGKVAPAERQKTLDELTPEDQAKAVQSMSPGEYVQYQANRYGRMMAEQAAAQHEEAAANERRALDALEVQRAAVAKTDADMKQWAADATRLANTKINPDRYRQQRGVFGAIRGLVASMIGGAMSQYTGGHNLALDQYNKNIENDIQAQHADLANQWKGLEARKGEIANEYARHGDLYRATLTYNLAAHEAAIGELGAQLQQYDPAGATAIRIRDGMTQLQQQQQQMLAAARQQAFKNNLEAAKVGLDIDKARRDAETEAKKMELERQKLGIEYGKLGIERDKAAATKAENVVWGPAQLAQLHPGMPTPPIAMSEKSYGAWLENQNKGQANVKGDLEHQEKENSTVIRNPWTKDRLVDDKGKEIRVGNPEIAQKLNEKIGYAQSAVDTLSDIRRSLDNAPGSTDRAAWQSIETNYELAKAAYVKSLGANPSSREMEAVQDAFGPNFDSFKNRVIGKGKGKAAVDTLIDGIKRNVDNDVGAVVGYKGKPIIKDTAKPPPAASTPYDEATKKLVAPIEVSADDFAAGTDDAQFASLKRAGVTSAQGANAIAQSARNGNTNMPEIMAQAAQNPTVVRALQFDVPPSKIALLDKLADDARNAKTEKERQQALSVLQHQAEEGTTSGMRALAQSYMASAVSTSKQDLPTTDPAAVSTPAPEGAP